MNALQSIVILLVLVAMAASPWIISRALKHDRDQGICICPTCDGTGFVGPELPFGIGKECPECNSTGIL